MYAMITNWEFSEITDEMIIDALYEIVDDIKDEDI